MLNSTSLKAMPLARLTKEVSGAALVPRPIVSAYTPPPMCENKHENWTCCWVWEIEVLFVLCERF